MTVSYLGNFGGIEAFHVDASNLDLSIDPDFDGRDNHCDDCGREDTYLIPFYGHDADPTSVTMYLCRECRREYHARLNENDEGAPF